jgi:hypothetical protein
MDLLFLKIMKVVSDKFSLLLVFLLGTMYAFAGNADGPPAPSPNGRLPPPPPSVAAPIDENIVILMIMALLFGIYIIYIDALKTKTPI